MGYDYGQEVKKWARYRRCWRIQAEEDKRKDVGSMTQHIVLAALVIGFAFLIFYGISDE